MELLIDTDTLAALGHPGRLAVFRLLARRAPHGVRPSEIAGALGMKPNTLSAHVTALTRAGLVQSERRGRAVRYRLDLGQVAGLVDFLVNDCCRGRPELRAPLGPRPLTRPNEGGSAMTDRKFDVLFICSGNSARSIFAEALLAKEGGDRFRAHSAGTLPSGRINPYALDLLKEYGHDIAGLRSKDVSEFQGPEAPALDFVFTVCDRAANEDCPPWSGQPVTAHWGMPDPVKATGTEAEKALAFRAAYHTLRRRLQAFVALPLDTLDAMSLQRRLDAIGEDESRGAEAN